MQKQGRLGDNSFVPADGHGCPSCPHACTGPAIIGSPDVLVNNKPALRISDNGTHAVCCGPNTWTAVQGCPSVLINGKAAHRFGDKDMHCGGMGNLIEGSPDVFVGEAIASSGSLGPFPSQDEAARAALNAANPLSIAENREYSGMIYQDPKTGQFYATDPQGAGLSGAILPVNMIPAGASEMGFYHTHGNYSLADGTPTDAAHDEFDSEHFSQRDINTANNRGRGNPGYRSYLGTPSGGYQVHDPSTGQINTF